MIIGQTVNVGTYYSPWFPRKGDAALFSAEVLQQSATGTLTMGVQTKNSEDPDAVPGPGTGTLGVTGDLTAVGVGTVSVSGMEELVRFWYVVAGDWTHFRVLPPAWQVNGA